MLLNVSEIYNRFLLKIKTADPVLHKASSRDNADNGWLKAVILY